MLESMKRVCLILLSTAIMQTTFGALVESPETEARALLDKFADAGTAKSIDAVSNLLTDDFVIIMIDPSVGLRAARFFTKSDFLEKVKRRFAQTDDTAATRIVRSIATSSSGDVFVTAECEEKTRIAGRHEWIKAREYFVMKPVFGRLLIRHVTSELTSYVPDISLDSASTKETK
jgi:ketosteroid isomerase-like protein